MKSKIKKYIEIVLYFALAVFAIILIIKYIVDNEVDIQYIASLVGYVVSGTMILSALYIKFFWRLKCCIWEKTPRLYKKYSGYIKSSYDSYGKEIDCNIEIKQTLFDTCVILSTDESKSRTIVSEVVKVNDEYVLYFTYINEPTNEHREHSDIHYGTVKLDINDTSHLVGDYWTDRNNQTKGIIELNRI